MSLIPTFRKNPGIHTEKYWMNNFLSSFQIQSESGIAIDSESMMSESAVWCAVNFLGSNIASLPCPILKTNGRKKNKDKTHPLYKILNLKVNNEMISMVYRETVMYHLFFWGVHYSIQVRDNAGRLLELWPVHPERVTLERNPKGDLVYFIRMADGHEEKYRRDQILHIPALGLNGLFGNALIDYSKDSIGLMLAMRSYANLFFANGSNMGVVFEHPGKLGEDAHKNLTKSLATAYSGLGKSHKAIVAEEGMKVVKAGTEPEKSQLIEGRQFSISDVARWFNLPPHVLKDLSKATFSNIEQQSLELVKFSIRVWLVRLEQSWCAWLLSDAEQQTYKIIHNVEGLLRGDSAARAEYYAKRFNTSSMTPNQIRDKEDENPIDEPWADELFVPLNMIPMSQISEFNDTKQPEQLPDPLPDEKSFRELKEFFKPQKRSVETVIRGRERIKKRFYPLFVDAAQKVVNRETLSIEKELKKQLGERAKSPMAEWVADFYRNFPEYMQKQLAPVFRTYAESIQEAVALEIGIDPSVSDDLDEEIRKYTDGFIAGYVESSQGQLIQQSEEGYEAVQVRADEWVEKRADKVAFNETAGLASMVARFSIIGAGYKLAWRTRGKSCPFCNQMDGKTVSRASEPFLKSGTELEDSEKGTMKVRQTLYPPLHMGCDCVVIAG